MVRCVPDFALSSCNDCSIVWAWHVADSINRCLSPFEIIILAPSHFATLQLKVVESNHALVARVYKAWVILEPLDCLDFSTVTFTLLISGARHSIKVVHVSCATKTNCKVLTTVAKSDFFAVFQGQAMLLCNGFGLKLHKQELVSHAHEEVETTWMESDWSSLLPNW